MTSNVPTDIKKEVNSSLWIGILLIGLGIAAIAVPFVSTLFTETWAALILLSAGFSKLVYATQTRTEGGFLWKILLSAIYIVTGIMLFANPINGVLTLTLLLGSFLLTEGTFELILAFRLRPQQNWVYVLGNGIVTLFLGAYIWFQFPYDAPWLIGTVLGASIVSTGFSRVMLSLNARSALNAANNTSEPTAST
jgi:uncharacterized membrane protein HdeD (DUF308 family)